jgi:excisionase family DNA binding protein
LCTSRHYAIRVELDGKGEESPSSITNTKMEYEETADEILNKKEAANALRISVRTADEWMKKGILPFIKMPTGAVRFRRSHILGLMDRYAVTTGGVA